MAEAKWNPEQREQAYQTYRSIEGKRSLKKTAEITGVPFGTLTYWSREDGWILRLRDDDDRDRAIMRKHADMRLTAEYDLLMDQLISLAHDGKPEDAVKLNATKHALALLGAVPQSAQPTPNEQQPTAIPANLDTMTDDELYAYVTNTTNR